VKYVKFWPNKDRKTVTLHVETDDAALKVELDLGELYGVWDDLLDAAWAIEDARD
jgi:hypothetical protein